MIMSWNTYLCVLVLLFCVVGGSARLCPLNHSSLCLAEAVAVVGSYYEYTIRTLAFCGAAAASGQPPSSRKYTRQHVQTVRKRSDFGKFNYLPYQYVFFAYHAYTDAPQALLELNSYPG